MKIVFTIFILLSFSIKSKAQSELYKYYIDGGRKDTLITPDWFNSALSAYKLDKSFNKFLLLNNRFLNDWLEMFEIRGNYSGLGNKYCMFYDHINQTFFFNSDIEKFNKYILEMGLSKSFSKYDLALFYMLSKGKHTSYIRYNKNDSIIFQSSVFEKEITGLLHLTIEYRYKKKTVTNNKVRFMHVHPLIKGRCVSEISIFKFNRDNTIKEIRKERFCCLPFKRKILFKWKKLNCPSDRRYFMQIEKLQKEYIE